MDNFFIKIIDRRYKPRHLGEADDVKYIQIHVFTVFAAYKSICILYVETLSGKMEIKKHGTFTEMSVVGSRETSLVLSDQWYQIHLVHLICIIM